MEWERKSALVFINNTQLRAQTIRDNTVHEITKTEYNQSYKVSGIRILRRGNYSYVCGRCESMAELVIDVIQECLNCYLTTRETTYTSWDTLTNRQNWIVTLSKYMKQGTGIMVRFKFRQHISREVNILNMQPRTKDKGWSLSLGVGRGANNPSP
jgi:hypothetical protein